MQRYTRAIIAVAVCCLWEAVYADERVVFTQLLHRHGARGPLPAANSSHWCPPAGCGLLNDEGKDMLIQLGKLLRHRYTVEYPTDYFSGMGANYSYDVINSRSTDKLRTMQSGEAMLLGMYGATSYDSNNETVSPVMRVWPSGGNGLAMDLLLSANAWEGYYMPLLANSSAWYKSLDGVVDDLFPTQRDETIAAMAAEAHYQGYCATVSAGRCLSDMQDLAASLRAVGTLQASCPTMAANFDKLTMVAGNYSKLLWGYDPTNALDGLRGSPGQNLAQQMVADFMAVVVNQQGGTASPLRMKHYSAHDSTVSPFGSTILGDVGDANFMPPFGEVYAIDLVVEEGIYYVRGWRGQPSQVPGLHTYTTTTLRLGGITANGHSYYLSAPTHRMPIEDFTRFIDSSKGTSAKGLCFVEDVVMKALKCGGVGPSGSSSCTVYRSVCGDDACDDGYVSNGYPSYKCVPAPRYVEEGMIASNTVYAISGGTFAVGLIVGAVILFFVGRIPPLNTAVAISEQGSERAESVLSGVAEYRRLQHD